MENSYKYKFTTKEEAEFNSFLNKTIRGTASKFFKKKLKIEETEDYLEEEILTQEELEILDKSVNDTNIKYALKNDKLDKAIESLTKNERSVILFDFMGELKTNEIAMILGININTVYIIRKRALNKLRKYLKMEE